MRDVVISPAAADVLSKLSVPSVTSAVLPEPSREALLSVLVASERCVPAGSEVGNDSVLRLLPRMYEQSKDRQEPLLVARGPTEVSYFSPVGHMRFESTDVLVIKGGPGSLEITSYVPETMRPASHLKVVGPPGSRGETQLTSSLGVSLIFPSDRTTPHQATCELRVGGQTTKWTRYFPAGTNHGDDKSDPTSLLRVFVRHAAGLSQATSFWGKRDQATGIDFEVSGKDHLEIHARFPTAQSGETLTRMATGLRLLDVATEWREDCRYVGNQGQIFAGRIDNDSHHLTVKIAHSCATDAVHLIHRMRAMSGCWAVAHLAPAPKPLTPTPRSPWER